MATKKYINQFTEFLSLIFTNPYLKFVFVILVGLSILFGINLMPDSFVYMEAANNSLCGNGFVVNCNLISASAFQPLYSYLMIPFIFILGYSAQALFSFHIVLFILTYYIYDRLLSNALKEINSSIKFLSIITLIYPYFTVLLSESLLIAFLGLYANFIFYFKGNQILKYLLVIILLILIFLTKNSAILIIVPIHLSLIDLKRGNRFKYYFKHFIFLAIIVLIFSFIKILLKSTDSHQLVIGGGQYSLKTYLGHIFRDPSTWIFGRSFMTLMYEYGIGTYLNLVSFFILGYVFIKSKIKIRTKFFLFLVYALAMHLFIFYNVRIDSDLSGRFLFWFNFVFIFFIISELHKKYFKYLFLLIIIMNSSNILYSRYKTFKPYNSQEVVLKLEYTLDARAFFTEEVRYPSLIYDKANSKYVILSPAYPSWINK